MEKKLIEDVLDALNMAWWEGSEVEAVNTAKILIGELQLTEEEKEQIKQWIAIK